MRSAVSCAVALTIAALMGAPLVAQPADSAVVGSWSGEAQITVSWTAQRALGVRLDIKKDGSVTGTVGDAQLPDGRIYSESRIARAMRLARQYGISGRLNGCLVRPEGILRDRVRLSLDLSGQTLAGDLQTSGSYEGTPSDRMLTAKGLVLHRVDRAIASDRRQEPPATQREVIAERATTPR
jgi:propanediol utilization protein